MSAHCAGDILRHVFSDGRANVAHRPDVIVCRLVDCTDVVVERKVLVQRYTQNLDVVS